MGGRTTFMTKIVCETGAAHRQSYSRCMAMIHNAYQAGADAIKFSVFKPDEMTLNRAEAPFVIESGPWRGKLHDLYGQTALCYHWIPELRRAALSVELDFIISIYHPHTVSFLPEWGIRTVKIASFELSYTDLLRAIAKEEYVKHVIVSTGSATEEEIGRALELLRPKEVTLLYCVSAYPAPPGQMNLNTLEDMKKFGVPVGLSDHSTGLAAPVMAVALGATIIEKHLKLDDENLDADFAIFPDRFKAMAEACRQAETIMGEVNYDKPKTFHRKEVDGKILRVVW